VRAVVIVLATLAVGAGCAPDDPLPTAPRVARPGSPKTAVIGASVTALPILGGGCCPTAYDINDAGQVVGRATDRDGNFRAFLWTATGGMQDLGTLGGAMAEARAINEAGQVVGLSQLASGTWHAFLWTPGHGMEDLGSLGDALRVATDVNAKRAGP
jgi:probable HAF family extracellular repeat protein